VSESISHYLGSLRKDEAVPLPLERGDKKRGRVTYEEVGCVACHGPGDETGVMSLAHVSEKYHFGQLGKFLLSPLEVRPSGRMPDMELSKKEAADLDAYLGGIGKVSSPPTEDQGAKVGGDGFWEGLCDGGEGEL